MSNKEDKGSVYAFADGALIKRKFLEDFQRWSFLRRCANDLTSDTKQVPLLHASFPPDVRCSEPALSDELGAGSSFPGLDEF